MPISLSEYSERKSFLDDLFDNESWKNVMGRIKPEDKKDDTE